MLIKHITRKTVLTIAASDPSGGAGVQRDIKVFADFGLTGLSAITALTIQNQKKVRAVLPVAADFVVKQIDTLLEENAMDAVKLGMLAKAETVMALAALFKKKKFKRIVVDPVLASSRGYPLLDKRGILLLKDRLLPFATIVTPNLNEAAILAGMKKVSNIEEMKLAAVAIKEFGPDLVLVKGGHLKTVNSEQLTVNSKKAVDVLYDGKIFKTFEAARIKGELHGTGCIFSSAIASCLANGMDMTASIKKAKIYTAGLIRQGSGELESDKK